MRGIKPQVYTITECTPADFQLPAVPGESPGPAMDVGHGFGLLLDVHDITGDSAWIAGARALAERPVSVYFDDVPLPRELDEAITAIERRG
jgi:hypothetical protein